MHGQNHIKFVYLRNHFVQNIFPITFNDSYVT